MESELKTNPFLRVAVASVQSCVRDALPRPSGTAAAGAHSADASEAYLIDVLGALRRKKDEFGVGAGKK